MFHCNENNSDKDKSLNWAIISVLTKQWKIQVEGHVTTASLGFDEYRLQICAATKQTQESQA